MDIAGTKIKVAFSTTIRTRHCLPKQMRRLHFFVFALEPKVCRVGVTLCCGRTACEEGRFMPLETPPSGNDVLSAFYWSITTCPFPLHNCLKLPLRWHPTNPTTPLHLESLLAMSARCGTRRNPPSKISRLSRSVNQSAELLLRQRAILGVRAIPAHQLEFQTLTIAQVQVQAQLTIFHVAKNH